MEYLLESTITEVTVYRDRARVVRSSTITLEAPGEHVLQVRGLPLQIERDSLRASGRGPAGLLLQGVEVSNEFHETAPEATLERLRAEIERLKQELAQLDEQSALIQQQQEWLRTLGEQSARSLAWGLARGAAKPEDASGVFSYTREEFQRLTTAYIETRQRHAEVTRTLQARTREYGNLGGGQRPDRLMAAIHIETPAPGAVSLELSYLVFGARWEPRYDARVDTAGGTVRLAQQALVRQQTGEDWRHVRLALSTARPSAATRLPDEPDPWYLDVRPPAPPSPKPAAHVMHRAMPLVGGQPQWDGAEQGDAPTFPPFAAASAPVAAELATAEVERSGPAQVFRVPGDVDVPTDGSPHTLSLGEYDLPCALEYVAMPLVAPGAHLRAKATNTTGSVLPAGELHVFQEGLGGDEYTGTTHLELTAEEAELPLYLGVDDNVTVKRELIERETDKGSILQGGPRRITYGYRVTLANHTGSAQRVLLQDRLPVPRHERIKVRVLEIRPQPSERTRLEQLTWELRLAPGEERRVEWRFVVEAPSDLEIAALP